MIKKKLTRRQEDILRFISSFYAENNITPTLHEIASFFSISDAGAWYHVDTLEKKGFIDSRGSIARGIRLREWNEYSPAITIIPFFDEERWLSGERGQKNEFNATGLRLEKGASYFALRMESGCLVNIHIIPGDILIFRKSSSAEDNDIVIARTEGSSVCQIRSFHRTKNKIILQAECDSIGNISCQSCEIQAILQAVVRRYE